MPKVFSLKEPSKEKKEELKEKLGEFPELKPRVTIAWPLSEERRAAFEMIKSRKIEEEGIIDLLKSDDFVENRASLYILSEIVSKEKPIAENFQKRVLPFLKELTQHENLEMRRMVFSSLGRMPQAIPLLKKLILDKEYEKWRLQSAANQNLAIEAAGNIPEARLFLEELAKSKKWWIKKRAKLILERGPAIQKKADEDKEEIQERGYSWMLASGKPLFATPFTADLAKRILELDKVEKKLRKEVGDRLIGIIVFGSTAKGYFRGSSDLDYAVLSKDYKVFARFRGLADSLNPCHDCSCWVWSERDEVPDCVNALFTGIFFGNRKKLLEHQKKFLAQIDEKEWDKIRRTVMTCEIDILKAKRILDINKAEIMEKTKQAIALLRIPPPRKKALEIINQRLSQFT